MGSKYHVKRNIERDEKQAGYPKIAYVIDERPGRVTINKLRLRLGFKVAVRQVYIFGLNHQTPNILNKMWRVRVFLGIAIGMVHTVNDGISPRV